jgi:hypothetical protein
MKLLQDAKSSYGKEATHQGWDSPAGFGKSQWEEATVAKPG